jgi:GT2 family glycosyltransferase
MAESIIVNDRDGERLAGVSSPDELGVVVLTYGANSPVARVFASLLQAGVPSSRVVVVHNPDGSVEGARAPVPDWQQIVMPRNVGYAGAMNMGVRRWLADDIKWILLLTHEVVIRRGALRRMLQAAVSDEQLGIVGPALRDREAGCVFSYGGRQQPDGRVNHITELPPAGPGGVARCAWVDGSVLLVRAAALSTVGMFEERFFMYFEEVDLCLRVRRAGWEVGVALDAVVETSPGFSQRPLAFAYLMARNGLAYAVRSRGIVAGMLLAGQQLRWCWALTPKPGGERWGDHDRRRNDWSQVRAILAGTRDFALGRWGPPPSQIRRGGDILATEFRRDN